jgi:hypothetical protein
LFIDERADERQREALPMILGGQAAGWPADFAEAVGEMRVSRSGSRLVKISTR